jgi:hypothetical protein
VSLAQQDELRRQLALLLGDSCNGIPQNLRSGLVPCREPPCQRRTVQVTIVKLIDSDPRKASFDWARTLCSPTFALPKRFANHPRPPYPSALSINQSKSAFGVQTPCRKLQTASALVQSGDFPPGSSSQQFPRTWQFHAFPAPPSFYLGIIVPAPLAISHAHVRIPSEAPHIETIGVSYRREMFDMLSCHDGLAANVAD